MNPFFLNFQVLTNTTTNYTGIYTFYGLHRGSIYTVKFWTPSGYYPTTPFVGTNISIDSDANVTTGFTQPITLTSAPITEIDFGIILFGYYSFFFKF